MEIDESDTQKLHAESLQLRNQQFYLGTLALAGSGLSAWVAPGLTVVTEGTIPEAALIGASLTWLALLALLYCWSLALRRVIVIISQYLEQRGLSRWEPEFRKFHIGHHRLYSSQTRYVAWAFTIYGFIAVVGSLLAAFSAPEKIKLSVAGGCSLSFALIIYIIVVWSLILRSHKRDKQVADAWASELSQPTPSKGAQADAGIRCSADA